MESVDRIKPSLTVLTDGQREKIHSDSMKILSSVGIQVLSKRAREIFARAIGSGAVADETVRIPPEIVTAALKSVPSSIEIYTRKGSPAFHLPGETRFGIGVTVLYYQEPETGRTVPFARQHMQSSARLGEALPSFDAVSTVGILQDVPVEVSDLYATLDMIANTTKPLVILVSDEDAFSPVLDLLEHLHGDLKSKPFVVPYFNPITPLVMNEETVNKMFLTIERGLPFIYSNMSMSGATTPITPAGTFVLMNAELLAGLVLSQLIKEGTPIFLGCLPTVFDMTGKGFFSDPMRFLQNIACAEMMAHYGVPHFGTGGGSIGWGGDLISAGQHWMNHLLSCMGKVGLAPFVGGVFGAKVFSPSLVVYANEVIEQARLFTRGFAFDDASVALGEIVEAGPGGNFLTSNLTLKLFRNAYYRSHVFPNLTFEDWQEKGCPRAEETLGRYTKQLMDGLQPPEGHGELMERGEAFIQSHRPHGPKKRSSRRSRSGLSS
jgi:trimethylamine--corrinoid protein Co-methyltransferase